MDSLISGTTVFVYPTHINLPVLITGTDLQLTSRLCIPCVDTQFLTITRARMKILFWLSRRLGLFLLSFFLILFYIFTIRLEIWSLLSEKFLLKLDVIHCGDWKEKKCQLARKRERDFTFLSSRRRKSKYTKSDKRGSTTL